MELNSEMTASTLPIPSNPQVPILSSLHRSMLLLSDHASEEKACTYNAHSLCFIDTSFAMIIMNHFLVYRSYRLSVFIHHNLYSIDVLKQIAHFHKTTVAYTFLRSSSHITVVINHSVSIADGIRQWCQHIRLVFDNTQPLEKPLHHSEKRRMFNHAAFPF